MEILENIIRFLDCYTNDRHCPISAALLDQSHSTANFECHTESDRNNLASNFQKLTRIPCGRGRRSREKPSAKGEYLRGRALRTQDRGIFFRVPRAPLAVYKRLQALLITQSIRLAALCTTALWPSSHWALSGWHYPRPSLARYGFHETIHGLRS